MEDLRDLARGIYPPLLASEGLAAALEAQARKAPVPTSVTADGVGRYPQEMEAAVYFCVLEALQNVAKYAGASRAEVRLAAAGRDLRFEVTDDGAGFDPETHGYGTGLQGHGGPAARPRRDARRAVLARRRHHDRRSAALPGARGGRVSTADGPAAGLGPGRAFLTPSSAPWWLALVIAYHRGNVGSVMLTFDASAALLAVAYRRRWVSSLPCRRPRQPHRLAAHDRDRPVSYRAVVCGACLHRTRPADRAARPAGR